MEIYSLPFVEIKDKTLPIELYTNKKDLNKHMISSVKCSLDLVGILLTPEQ